MKAIKPLFRIATLTLAIAACQQVTAAGYLKIDGIKGESRSAAPTMPSQSSNHFRHGVGSGAGKASIQQQPSARGGLDRDIIRRQTATTTSRLPRVGATNLHGIEPDEID